MKKLISLLLTFAMLFSLAMPAMAADNTGKDVTATFDPKITITDITYSGETVKGNPELGYEYLIPADFSDFETDYIPVIITINGTNLEYAANEEEVLLGVSFSVGGETQTVTMTLSEAVAEGFTYQDGSLVLDPSTFADGLTMAYRFSNDNGETWSDPVTLVYKQCYFITVSATENGTISCPEDAAADSTVYLTVTPEVGYELDTLVITGPDGEISSTKTEDGRYSFTMPAGNVTIRATFRESTTDPTTKTIYFDNTDGWATVYAYAWDVDSSAVLGGWPGTAMTKVEGEESIYAIEVPTDTVNIIFNNGSGTQTADQTIPTDDKNLYTFSTNEWSVYGSTTDDTATITGVSLSGNGVTYDEATKTYTIAHDATDIIMTITGTNFANLTEDYLVRYKLGYAVVVHPDHITVDAEKNTATAQFVASDFDTDNGFEIQYTTDNGNTYIDMGIYVTYDDGTNPTYAITTFPTGGGTITAPDSAAVGDPVTVTFTPNEGYVLFEQYAYDPDNPDVDVILTQGADAYTYTFTMPAHDVQVVGEFPKDGKAREDLYFNNDGNSAWTNVDACFLTDTGLIIDRVTLTMAENGIYTIPEDKEIPNLTYQVYFSNGSASTATVEIPTGEENMFTLGTTTNVYGDYEGTWSKYTPSQPPTDVTSAEISWGSMAFTYTDGENGADGAWTVAAHEEGKQANDTVIVTNTGSTTFVASAAYTPAGEFGITGSLDDDKTIAANESGTFTLTLSGKPNKALKGEKIGTVTVKIEEAAPVTPVMNVSAVYYENPYEGTQTISRIQLKFFDDAGTEVFVTDEYSGNTVTVTVPAGAATFKVFLWVGSASFPNESELTEVPTVGSNVVYKTGWVDETTKINQVTITPVS